VRLVAVPWLLQCLPPVALRVQLALFPRNQLGICGCCGVLEATIGYETFDGFAICGYWFFPRLRACDLVISDNQSFCVLSGALELDAVGDALGITVLMLVEEGSRDTGWRCVAAVESLAL
jgi:hypothetical protein